MNPPLFSLNRAITKFEWIHVLVHWRLRKYAKTRSRLSQLYPKKEHIRRRLKPIRRLLKGFQKTFLPNATSEEVKRPHVLSAVVDNSPLSLACQ